MGRYIDWSHVVGRYKDAVKLFDSTNAGSFFIPHAEAEVDGRLAVRYAVPFTNTPTPPLLVQDLAIDVAYYKLIVNKKAKEALQQSIEDRFKGLINGTILITDANGPIGTAPNTAWYENSYHTSFGMDNAINWRVSSEAQEEVQNERGQFNGFFP